MKKEKANKLAKEIIDALIDSFGCGSLLDDAWTYTEEEYRKEYIDIWTQEIVEILGEIDD